MKNMGLAIVSFTIKEHPRNDAQGGFMINTGQ